ncbi:MAG: hypothetical protein VW806_06055, partial [Halieaceae bacterium]
VSWSWVYLSLSDTLRSAGRSIFPMGLPAFLGGDLAIMESLARIIYFEFVVKRKNEDRLFLI